jgi:hypothetical protein
MARSESRSRGRIRCSVNLVVKRLVYRRAHPVVRPNR